MQNDTPLLHALQAHEKEVRGFLTRRLGCAQRASDILQDLAERLLLHPALSCSNPRSYLFRAASNALIDQRRAERCREAHARAQQQNEEHLVDERSPERCVIALETVNIIEKALRELSPLSREILHLYRIEGLTQQQIAGRLGISRSTVDRRLAEAIDHWRRRLDGGGR